MNLRSALAFIHDAIAVAVAWLLALWLRFNFDVPAVFLDASLAALLWVVPLYAMAFWHFGLYRGLWRFASLNDLQRMLASISACALLTSAAVLMFGIQLIPRSVLILQPALLILMMGGSRFAYRAWKESRLYGELRWTGQPVLVLGAGEAAASLVREMMRSPDWRVVGLLDDDMAKHNQLLHGVRVLGPLDNVSEWAARYEVQHAIVAMPQSSPAERRRAMELAGACGLTVLTVPVLDDILSQRVSISQVRRIELEDLLGREPVVLDDAGLHRLLTDKTVLVTGAGGSIGSELARQIARYAPRLLILFEISEYALYQLEQEFAECLPEIPKICLVGDIRDLARVNEIFSQYRPDIVFHAAAYKHVPLMEEENAWEAVRNNVLGTLRLAACSRQWKVSRFVMISTDKAVNPTNIMGATKRLSEMICQCLSGTGGSSTAFITVRFGNVLGSNGSVIPKFREQIAKGGPVTVTHPEITRYFMSIPEAAQLVLQSASMGERGEIFVLDMGMPIKIIDLARDMIRLSGFSEQEVQIEITGLRPGEKLFEELIAADEQTLPTPHPKLRKARLANIPDETWVVALESWLVDTSSLAPSEVRQKLMGWVPEYRPAAHQDQGLSAGKRL